MTSQHCNLQKLTLPSLFTDMAQCEMEYDGGIDSKNWSWKQWLTAGLIAIGVIITAVGIAMITGGAGFEALAVVSIVGLTSTTAITGVGIAGIVATVAGGISIGIGVDLLIHDLI